MFFAKLVICSQTFISLNWIYSKKLEILYEFDVLFHTKARKSSLSCFTDCTKHASAGALIHRQQTIHWIFTQTKLSSIYRHSPFCHLLGLEETSSVAYNLGETQTCKYFFYFSGREDSAEILASVWQEEENFEVLNRCYIQIYRTIAFSCVIEKLLIFYIFKIYVMWSSCKRSSGTLLGQW